MSIQNTLKMGRFSVILPVFIVALTIGVCQGYFSEDNINYGASRQAPVAVPRVYGQGLSIPYQQQQQQAFLLRQQQAQKPMLLGRIGRSYNFPSSASKPRVDEEDYADEADDEPLSYAASKRKKNKNKKKKTETKLSFPRRIFKKISTTTSAVFGAPKYIYTRYRDTYGFGKKQEHKKQSKGHDDDGWVGWDAENQDDRRVDLQDDRRDDRQDDRRVEYQDDNYRNDNYGDDNNGWGWESKAAASSADEYRRKTGGKGNSKPRKRQQYRRYNKYSYSQPDEMREMTPLTSLNAWVQ